jgi:hypothetical protein
VTEFVFNLDKNFKLEFQVKIYFLVADFLAETDAMEDILLPPGDSGSITESLPETFTTKPDIVNHTLSHHATTTSMELLPLALIYLNTLPLLALSHVLLDIPQLMLMINNLDLRAIPLLEFRTLNKKSLLTDLLKHLSLSMKIS